MTRIAQQRGRKILTVAAAFSVGLAGVLATGAAAGAAPVAGPVVDQNGSLTIHKFEYPADGSQNPSGTGTDPSKPLAGVSFQVCRIDNITSLADPSNVGWAQVKGINPISGSPLTGTVAGTNSTTSFPLSNCQTVVSGANGATPTLTNLGIGAYLVTETAAPAGVTKGDPFVVTVPTPADTTAGASNTGKWEYNVNVYPKNVKATAPTKSIADQIANGVKLGDSIGFGIRQVIPALPTGQNYTKVTVTDTLDAKLDYVAGSAVVKLNGTALPAGAYTLTTAGDVIKVVLTGPASTPGTGLALVKAGDVLTVDFQAKANATGAIDNIAYVNVNDLDLDGNPGTGPETPTNPVTTRWGNLLGEKTNADGSAKLAGAKFDVYLTNDTDGTCGPVTTADLVPANKVPTTITSDATGKIGLPGLWVGDTRTAGNDVSNRCYILQETAAPAGFVLPSGNAALHAVNVTSTGAPATVPTFTVKNDQQLVPGLPLTGGQGQVLLIGGGVALLGMAVGGALLARRKRAANA